MALSGNSLDALLDLVEIKLSCVEIFDREDAREVKNLEHCRNELRALRGEGVSAKVMKLPLKRAGAGIEAQAV